MVLHLAQGSVAVLVPEALHLRAKQQHRGKEEGGGGGGTREQQVEKNEETGERTCTTAALPQTLHNQATQRHRGKRGGGPALGGHSPSTSVTKCCLPYTPEN